MIFYDWQKTFSYNRRWNFIISARGYGKTFGIRLQALKDFRKRKQRFLAIVRTKDDIAPIASDYFAKVQKEGYFPEYEFKFAMKERAIYARDRRFEDSEYEIIGYIVAMTEEQFLKNLTFVYGLEVRRIIYDEAIIEKKDRYHRYNPREWAIINGIISTVTRETPSNPSQASVYLFGNAVDLTCPLFEELGIRKVPTEHGYYFYGDDVLLHYVEPVNQEGFETETLSGRALAGSKEGDKLFGNEFEKANDTLHIARKPKQAKYWRGYAYNGRVFGLWIDHYGGLVYVTSKAPKNQEVFALTYDDASINYALIKGNSPHVKLLGDLFYQRLLRFDSVQTRERFADMCLSLGIV